MVGLSYPPGKQHYIKAHLSKENLARENSMDTSCEKEDKNYLDSPQGNSLSPYQASCCLLFDAKSCPQSGWKLGIQDIGLYEFRSSDFKSTLRNSENFIFGGEVTSEFCFTVIYALIHLYRVRSPTLKTKTTIYT